ncbi:MAG: BatA domain-containing protein [Flavobacteriales bacterium]|nr:BatA domain-containing protein [Flavobacteriales bacterium]
MSFLHPAFLWALSVLAIPVLIHLFQLRRFKRIDFPNVRFLAEVSRQTRARRKLQHWLVLLARCLALAALVFAFAQPYVPGTTGEVKAGSRVVSVYIDDSFSMDGQNAGGRLLDQARKGAQDAVMAQGPTDRLQILTGRFEGRQQMLMGREEALQAAAQASSSPFTRPLSKVLLRQREALSKSDAPVKRAFLFTDLQRGITDVEAWVNDSTIPVVIVPLQPVATENLSIDSVRFDSPVRRVGQRETLHVTITNHGEQELVNVPLRLRIDGVQRALTTFSVGGGASVDTAMQFVNDATGHHWGELSIADQPVTFDDKAWIAYSTIERLRILLIGGQDVLGDRAVKAVFDGDSTHVFTERGLRDLDLSMLAQQDLVVLNALPEMPSGTAQALYEFARAGGSVAFFPPSQGDPTRFASFFDLFRTGAPARMDTGSIRVDRIDLEHPFYRDIFQTMPRNVDLPVARERWSLRPPPGSDVLLRAQDGTPYLVRVEQERGSIHFCTAPLAEQAGNLTRHALFATSLLRMAELARPMGSLYHTIGAESVLPLDGIDLADEAPPVLRGPDGLEALPEVRRRNGGSALVLHDEELPPGAYALVSGKDTLCMVALNLSRVESALGCFPPDELRSRLDERGLTNYRILTGGTEDLSLRLTELDQGRKLWKWFILFALLFLAAETILLRLWR